MCEVECSEANEFGFVGNWDSFNVADVTLAGDEATIKLNTNVLIEMGIQSEAQGSVDLTGFLKKTVRDLTFRRQRSVRWGRKDWKTS